MRGINPLFMLLFYRIVIWAAILFQALSGIGILPVPILEQNNSWMGQAAYHLIGYALFEILWYVSRRMRMSLSPHIFLWLIAAIIHNIPGTMYGLFTRYSWYDQIAHFALMGTFLALIAADFTGKSLSRCNISNTLIIMAGAFCLTMTLGVANEIIEYVLPLSQSQHLNPAELSNDTANDLLMNFLGAALGIGYSFARTTGGASARGAQ